MVVYEYLWQPNHLKLPRNSFEQTKWRIFAGFNLLILTSSVIDFLFLSKETSKRHGFIGFIFIGASNWSILFNCFK